VFDANGSLKFFNINTGKENLGRIEAAAYELRLTNATLKGTYTGNKIIAETNVNVTGTVQLKAGVSITLKPGFKAAAGCSLKVTIDNTLIVVPQKYYYVKDHLGSTRVTVNAAGEIASSYDYDPWGMILDGRSSNFGISNEKYKFTGKERDDETNYDYFGARYYDSRIGRWLQVDPLVEKYPGWSSFSYCKDNSVISIDPNGKDVKIKNDVEGNVPNGFNTSENFGGYQQHFILNYAKKSSESVRKLENQINSKLVKEFNDPQSAHYAPNVAKFIKTTEIPVGIVSDMPAYGAFGSNKILLNDNIVKSGKDSYTNLDAVILHEVVHDMGGADGNDPTEVAAYAAEFASGYISFDDAKKNIKNEEGYAEFIKNRNITNDKELKKELYNYGKTIIGK